MDIDTINLDSKQTSKTDDIGSNKVVPSTAHERWIETSAYKEVGTSEVGPRPKTWKLDPEEGCCVNMTAYILTFVIFSPIIIPVGTLLLAASIVCSTCICYAYSTDDE